MTDTGKALVGTSYQWGLAQVEPLCTERRLQ